MKGAAAMRQLNFLTKNGVLQPKTERHKTKSGQRESNPPPELGKLIYYRCTMSAERKALETLTFQRIFIIQFFL